MTEWQFNKQYADLEQVAEFLPAFLDVLAEIEGAGQYRYNAAFKGRIPGIEGAREDTAIYLLQGLERARKEAARIDELLQAGYIYVTELTETRRYGHVVLTPTRHMGEQWAEFHDVRLVPRDGRPYGLLPKGRSVNGALVSGRNVLAS
jgi:hypothetical protein